MSPGFRGTVLVCPKNLRLQLQILIRNKIYCKNQSVVVTLALFVNQTVAVHPKNNFNTYLVYLKKKCVEVQPILRLLKLTRNVIIIHPLLDRGTCFKLTHKPGWVVRVSSNFSIYFDQPLHDYLLDLTVGEGILEAITQKNYQRQRLTQFVRPCAGTGCKHPSQLVQHPRLGRMQPL